MKPSQNHLPSLLSSLVFALGIVTVLGISLITGVGALFMFATEREVDVSQIVISVAYSFQGLLLIWIIFHTIRKFLHKPSADEMLIVSIPRWQIVLCFLGTLASILIGGLISDNKSFNWILLPILTIPAVTLPIWLIYGLSVKHLQQGAAWQTWSLLGVSMTVMPFLLIILEMMIALVMIVIATVYIVTQPELIIEMERLIQRMQFVNPNSEEAINLLTPYLSNPKIILAALAYFALLVPALEELIKPMGVWLFGRRIESTAQGFVFGAISGAGYALIETFGVSAQVDEWASLLTSRIGTGLLHITTTALMGAGIVAAWKQRRYLFAFGIYILAVTLHGLWNATAIAYSFSMIANPNISLPVSMEIITLIVMGILSTIFIALLIYANRKLRRSTPSIEETIPETTHDKINP